MKTDSLITYRRSRRDRTRTQHGFSLAELLVVVAIVVIMAGITMLYMPTHVRAIAIDNANAQLVDVFRYAQQQALNETQTMRVELTPGGGSVPGTIVVVDQETIRDGTSDDHIIRNETLPLDTDSTVATDLLGLNKPPAPFNFLAPPFQAGKLTIYFLPDGTVVKDADEDPPVPQSFTLINYTPISPGNPDLNAVRAITMFGPTGAVRVWRYDPATSQFQEM